MKQFLRIVLAAFLIAFVLGAVTTGCSCQKKGGGTAPDSSNGDGNSGGSDGGGKDGKGGGGSGGGSGGGGDGGTGDGGTTPGPDLGVDIKITITDANLAKMQGSTILLKLSAFPASVANSGVHFGDIINPGGAISRRKAFEIVNEKAKEGMLLVGKGNVASASEITTPAIGSYDTRTTVRAFTSTAHDDDGIHVISATTAHGDVPSGLSFISVFANKNNPDSDAKAAADAEPFAFSSIPTLAPWPAQPIFYCIAVAPTLTATVAATDKLVGSHKADCYVTSVGASFGDGITDEVRREQWFNATAPFKREIQVAIAAVKTDDKTIADLMPGADDNAKVANFKNGIDAVEMKAISDANGFTPFKKIKLKIVDDTTFGP